MEKGFLIRTILLNILLYLVFVLYVGNWNILLIDIDTRRYMIGWMITLNFLHTFLTYCD
jgi:hypothetical protein